MTNLRLYPYQKKGVLFLAHRRHAYLADGMGLGKSAQAIRAGRSIKAVSTLILCPASAVPNWHREWDKWGGYGDLTVMSYARAIRRRPTPAALCLLDEAHYCKSPGAQRTRVALMTARTSGRAWLLSGTPMPNDPTELWSVVKFLWPGIAEEAGCTTAYQWAHKFCKLRATPWGMKPYAVQNGAKLRQALRGIMLRRLLPDVGLELPPLRVELSRLPKDEKLETALEDYAALELESAEGAYTSTLRRLLGTAKALPVAKQIVEELDHNAYHKIVVLYYHKDVGRALKGYFAMQGYDTVGFDGSTRQADRQKAIDEFQKGAPRVFLSQQMAAGIAINLTAASELVLVEPAWSPSDNEQAIKRVHRIGQDNPCRARIFAVSNTLDEAIMSTLTNKTRMQKELGFG